MIGCPKCKYPFFDNEINIGLLHCPSCRSAVEVVGFPALHRGEERVVRQSAAEDDARCAFHPENQAKTVCERCGRIICSVCALPLGERTVCPQCINRTLSADPATPVTKRMAWDKLALMLVVHPLLLFFWFGTFFTALASLIISITCFNKPQGLVPRGKSRFVVAIVMSLCWMATWVVLAAFFGNKVLSAFSRGTAQ
jgi:hypothetical protein